MDNTNCGTLKKFKDFLFLEQEDVQFSLLEMSASSLAALKTSLTNVVRKYGLYVDMSAHTVNRLLDIGQQGRRDNDAGATANHSFYRATGQTKADYSAPREAGIDPNLIFAMFRELFDRYGTQIIKYRANRREFVATVKKGSMNISFKIDYDRIGNTNRLNIITIMDKVGFVPNASDDKVFKL